MMASDVDHGDFPTLKNHSSLQVFSLFCFFYFFSFQATLVWTHSLPPDGIIFYGPLLDALPCARNSIDYFHCSPLSFPFLVEEHGPVPKMITLLLPLYFTSAFKISFTLIRAGVVLILPNKILIFSYVARLPRVCVPFFFFLSDPAPGRLI